MATQVEMYEHLIEALKPFLADGVTIAAEHKWGITCVILQQGNAILEMWGEGDDCAHIAFDLPRGME